MALLGPDQLDAVARLFRVLAEPTRLAILQELRRDPRSVNDLVDALADFDAKQANVSKQLGILFDAGLLDRERSGNCVVYSIREPAIFELCEIVCGKLKRDAEKQYAAFAGKPRR
jgi:DNA-binding transcriptional ArsR family regulator